MRFVGWYSWTNDTTITNITVQNSIMFNFHAQHVRNLRISNITIHSLGPNTDGFNVAGTDMEIKDSNVRHTTHHTHNSLSTCTLNCCYNTTEK
jgi:hypothetical protein